MKFKFGAVCQRAVDVDVLPKKRAWIKIEINQISKLIVEVSAGDGIAAAEQRLLKTRFQRVVPLGPQTQVGHDAKAALAKRFFKARLLDSFRVSKAQTRAGKNITATNHLRRRG